MFTEAFLKTSRNMVEAKSDIERLRFMPQKIEGGKVIDFTGEVLFKVLNTEDVVIFDMERVKKGKRFTTALSRDYFIALDGVMHLFSRDGETSNDEPKEEYGADIYKAVGDGDKKGLRKILREYVKVKWDGLNEDDIDDAVFDLNDCATGKDVDGAREIVTELIGEDICEVKEEESSEPSTSSTEAPEPSNHTPANEDEAELLADLDDAVKDEDWEDVETLLNELGEGHPCFMDYKMKLPSNKEDESKPTTCDKDSDAQVITEICEDIDAALGDGDTKDAKKYLEELAAEAGKDSDKYEEYEAKVNPPKKETRRSRRDRG